MTILLFAPFVLLFVGYIVKVIADVAAYNRNKTVNARIEKYCSNKYSNRPY